MSKRLSRKGSVQRRTLSHLRKQRMAALERSKALDAEFRQLEARFVKRWFDCSIKAMVLFLSQECFIYEIQSASQMHNVYVLGAASIMHLPTLVCKSLSNALFNAQTSALGQSRTLKRPAHGSRQGGLGVGTSKKTWLSHCESLVEAAAEAEEQTGVRFVDDTATFHVHFCLNNTLGSNHPSQSLEVSHRQE